MERERGGHSGLISALSRSTFPTLNGYIALSVLCAGVASITVASTFYSHPEIRTSLEAELKNSTKFSSSYGVDPDYMASLTTMQVVHYVLSDSALLWVAVNSYFAVLAMLAKIIIRMTFKELSRQEETLSRHALFAYLLYSVVFLSVVSGAQRSHRVLPWLLWLGFFGFLNTLFFITYHRFKFISPSSGAHGDRISVLSFALFFMSLLVTFGMLRSYSVLSWSCFIIIAFDVMLAMCRATHALLRCISASSYFSARPDKVRHFNYWLSLVFNVTTESIQFVKYLHLMVFSSGINITCIFFFYHIRNAYNNLAGLFSRHQRHKRIFEHIEKTYPNVKSIDDTDRCVVCWEELGESRRLPCSHQFHDWCLMWWLAQDSSCPTCRRVVSSPHNSLMPSGGHQQANSQNTTFRFSGGAFLPAFSIEISTGFAPFFRRNAMPDEAQMASMAEQVREMFPQMPVDAIMEDLRQSGSAQATIENILEGRVLVGGEMIVDESDDESWHGDDIDGHSDDVSMILGDDLTTADNYSSSSSSKENLEDESYFALKRREMIEEYRKRYIASEKGADLRANGY